MCVRESMLPFCPASLRTMVINWQNRVNELFGVNGTVVSNWTGSAAKQNAKGPRTKHFNGESPTADCKTQQTCQHISSTHLWCVQSMITTMHIMKKQITDVLWKTWCIKIKYFLLSYRVEATAEDGSQTGLVMKNGKHKSTTGIVASLPPDYTEKEESNNIFSFPW